MCVSGRRELGNNMINVKKGLEGREIDVYGERKWECERGEGDRDRERKKERKNMMEKVKEIWTEK